MNKLKYLRRKNDEKFTYYSFFRLRRNRRGLTRRRAYLGRKSSFLAVIRAELWAYSTVRSQFTCDPAYARPFNQP